MVTMIKLLDIPKGNNIQKDPEATTLKALRESKYKIEKKKIPTNI